MGRTLSTDLQTILAAPTREIDWTLDITFPAIDPLYLATAPLELVKGDYTNDIENISEIRQTLESATDQVNVELQNKDSVLALHILNNLTEWQKAQAVIGRLYRGSGLEVWIEMFRGAVQKPEIDDAAPYNVTLDVVTDTVSPGAIVCNRTLGLACSALFKHPRQCGYTGSETSCDHVLKSKHGCDGLANSEHFLGMEHRYNPDVSIPGTGGNTGVIIRPPCPRLDQFILVKGNGTEPIAKTVEFLTGRDLLFNPVTKTFHAIKSLEIIKDQNIFEIILRNGAKSYSSTTHKILRNRDDQTGAAVTKFFFGDGVLNFCDGFLIEARIESAKQIADSGDVMRIEMLGGHIYAAGNSADKFIVAHNSKNPIDIE